PLTALPNRALFLDRLSQALIRRRRDAVPMTILVADLRGFTRINESLGRAVGDRVLIAAAGRLREVLRERDTPARLYDDKFGVLCESVRTAAHRAQIVERVLSAIAAPFALE